MTLGFNSRKYEWKILCACVLLWSLWVLFNFYSVTPNPFPIWLSSIKSLKQVPFSFSGFVAQWIRFSLIAGSGFLVLGLQWIIGRTLRIWLGLFSGHSWIDVAIDWGIGIWFVVTAWLALGYLGLWYALLLGFMLFLFIVILIYGNFPKRIQGWGVVRLGWPDSFPIRVLALLGCLYVALDLLQAFIPETFYDTLGYLLGIPEGWWLNHGIRDNPETFCSGMAHGAGLYFLNGFLLKGNEVSKILSVISVPACALLVGGWTERYANRNAAWLTMGMTLTFPLLSMNSWAARADGWMAFFLLLVFFALEKSVESDDWVAKRWMFLAGLSAGMALSMKFSAAFGLIPLTLVYSVCLDGKKFKYKQWLPAVGGLLLSVGPWFVKNAVYTGNPFYPYGQDWFDGRSLSPGLSEVLIRKNHLFEVSGFWEWIKLPWALTIPGSPYAQMTGPFLLAFLPALLLFYPRLKVFRRPFVAALLFILMGVAFSRNLRFELAAYVILAAALSIFVFQVWDEKGLRVGALVFAVMAILNFCFLAVISEAQFDPWQLWTGSENRGQYLERRLPDSYFVMANWVHRTLSKDSRVLVVGDARGPYYDVDRITNWIDDPPLLQDWIKRSVNPTDIHRFMRRWGVTHLAVNARQGVNVSLQNGNPYQLSTRDWLRWDDFLQQYGSVVFRAPWLVVYEIQRTPREGHAEIIDLIPFLSEPTARWYQAKQGTNEEEKRLMLERLKVLVPVRAFLKAPEIMMSP